MKKVGLDGVFNCTETFVLPHVCSYRENCFGHVHSNVRDLILGHLRKHRGEALFHDVGRNNLRKFSDAEQGCESMKVVYFTLQVKKMLDNVALGPLGTK